MNTHDRGVSRRNFLKCTGSLAALSLLARGRPGLAAGLPMTDYKALVCVYLAGGNDAANTVVPSLDNPTLTAYRAVRGSALALLPGGQYNDMTQKLGHDTALEVPYALHGALPDLYDYYGQGKLAVVLNMGNLADTQTRAAPVNLYSHSDQMLGAQTGAKSDGTGWGGRLLDLFDPAALTSLDAVSVAGTAVLPQGKSVSYNVIPTGGTLALNGVNWWPDNNASPALAAIRNGLLQQDGGSPLRRMANKIFGDGMRLASDLQALSSVQLATAFPQTPLGNQLQYVARLIRARTATNQPGRQVFFCVLGGFDTHSGQLYQQYDLFLQLNDALKAFHTEMSNSGNGSVYLGDKVVAFTQSEFGRTLQPSGTGTDHGWGGHHFVLGDAVNGGVFGTMPSYVLGSSDDANGRGAWKPTISTDQFAATLGKWFVPDPSVDWNALFPAINGAPADLGFLA
jgi:uncharacterized protein (DUF1501 family)